MNRVHWLLILPLLLFCLLPANACSKNPTGPAHPFCGQWVGIWRGYYISLTGPLELEVKRDGSFSAGGGINYNNIYGDPVNQSLRFSGMVSDSGTVDVTGRWTGTVVPMGYLRYDVVVTGRLNLATGTGSGTFAVASPSLSSTWSVVLQGDL